MLDRIAMKWPDMAAEINLWLKTQRIVETTTHKSKSNVITAQLDKVL